LTETIDSSVCCVTISEAYQQEKTKNQNTLAVNRSDKKGTALGIWLVIKQTKSSAITAMAVHMA